jgi:hypothetical protein
MVKRFTEAMTEVSANLRGHVEVTSSTTSRTNSKSKTMLGVIKSMKELKEMHADLLVQLATILEARLITIS